jgi:Domain of unknown function (DUF5619)
MKTLTIGGELDLDFGAAKKLADAVAATLLGQQATCLSWFDRPNRYECPANASECHDGACPIPGYVEYATSRGAELKVDVAQGTYVFCYRSVAEFG